MSVLGFPIPAAGPVFLTALVIHVLAGITAVLAAIGAAVTRKGSPRHVRFGRTYLVGLLAVVLTMAVMAVVRWPHDVHLLAIGVVSGAAALVGFIDRRSGRRDLVHVVAMGLSFVALLTAFYVDNGPNLPLWNLLPEWAFWVLPSLVGAPIIARAVLRRRDSRTAVGSPR